MTPSIAVLLAAWLLAPATTRAAEEVVVFAAASLTDALEEIGQTWRSATGHVVLFNLGASSDLGRQVRAGAPADVFFSADREQMDLVERSGQVRAADRVDLLSNTLVVVMPAASYRPLASPGDLLGMKRLVLADPEAVPAGVYGRKWLESLGLWDRLRDRVVPALNVRAALAAVESENADAAIVYRTDAVLSRRARIVLDVPRGQGPEVVYVVAPIAASAGSAGRDFVRFLSSPTARAVFEKHGFIVLGAR
jgi:molybdate transport system substrate-binding protein